MSYEIQKRNGDIVPFDKRKIIDAINLAFLEVDKEIGYETARKIADKIEQDIENFYNRNLNLDNCSLDEAIQAATKKITVEEIQDLVEEYLMSEGRKDVARAYIRYRYKREVAREHKSDFANAITEKLTAADVKNQNANVDEYSFGGRVGEANSVMMRKIALDNYMSPMAKYNHLNNIIYIHDLDSYAVGMHNCLSIPFDKLLANGFNTRQTDVRPANSINTAFQLIAVIFQLQSLQQFGGVSATHLDWTMVPYVRRSFAKHYRDGAYYLECPEEFLEKVQNTDLKDLSIEDQFYKQYPAIYNYALDMTKKETLQAAEGMYHNLNTLQSRSGNQLPFTSINYGTCTLPEGRMVTKALLEISLKGLGKLHKTSIFPCGIFQCMKGVNRKEGEPNYDLYKLALKSTAKRLYPNYANVDWSGNAGYDINDPCTYFSTMGKPSVTAHLKSFEPRQRVFAA